MSETALLVSANKSETFYPVHPDMPAIGVRVVVSWAGREFCAARTWDKKAGGVRWVTHMDGKLVTLPPKGQGERWGGEPEAWRPERPELWKAPLPEPLVSCGLTGAGAPSGRGGAGAPGRLAPGCRAQAVDAVPGAPRTQGWRGGCVRGDKYNKMAAQAEQSAQTQAEIRAELGDDEEAAAGRDDQWWLTEPLSYSPMGEVSLREAEGRVARAILTDGIRGRHGGPGGLTETSSALSGLVHETLLSTDAEGMTERFEPSPRDLSDYVTAFGWFAALNPPELWHRRREPYTLSQAQCVLVWRMITPPLSWRRIGRQTRGNHETLRRVYGAALAGVHRAANGQPVLQHVRVKDRMAALREANRRARVER